MGIPEEDQINHVEMMGITLTTAQAFMGFVGYPMLGGWQQQAITVVAVDPRRARQQQKHQNMVLIQGISTIIFQLKIRSWNLLMNLPRMDPKTQHGRSPTVSVITNGKNNTRRVRTNKNEKQGTTTIAAS